MEYHIPIEEKIGKDASEMCNLSQRIKDDVKARIIMNMHREGCDIELIARSVEKSVDEVKAVIEKEELVLV